MKNLIYILLFALFATTANAKTFYDVLESRVGFVAPYVKSKDQSGSTASDPVTIGSGASADGNSGNITISPATPSGAGNRGATYVYGSQIGLAADSNLSFEAGTGNITGSTDGDFRIVPWSNVTPIFELWEGSGTYFAQLRSTALGGLQVNAEGGVFKLGLQEGLLDYYWGDDFPAIVLDGDAAVTDAAGATGLVLKGNGAQLVIATQDIDEASASSTINIVSGANDGAGGSGGNNRITGDVDGSNTSGGISDTTGNNPGGPSGGYTFTAGSSSTAENQGDYSVSAGQLIFTSADANGISFQQSGSGDISFLANTGQINLAVKDGDSVNIKSNDATDEPELKIFDADNSASAAMKVPETLANSYDLVLPTAPFSGTQYLASQTLPTTYTPTLSHTTGVASSTFKWHREGHFLIISGQILFNNTGDNALLTIPLPGVAAGSPVIDTSELVGGTGTGNDTSTILGTGLWFDNGVGWKFLYPKYSSTTTFSFFVNTQAWFNNLAANGDSLNFTVKVPITGW